jgi:thiamine transporter ThiT
MELDDEKLSFSKKVVGTVTLLFVGIIMFSAGTWLIYREIPDRLIDYVDGPFSVIISGYFAKAGMENFLKLRGGAKEKGT